MRRPRLMAGNSLLCLRTHDSESPSRAAVCLIVSSPLLAKVFVRHSQTAAACVCRTGSSEMTICLEGSTTIQFEARETLLAMCPGGQREPRYSCDSCECPCLGFQTANRFGPSFLLIVSLYCPGTL